MFFVTIIAYAISYNSKFPYLFVLSDIIQKKEYSIPHISPHDKFSIKTLAMRIFIFSYTTILT